MILFYTDPHLGLKRKAHSTPASSAAREQHTRAILHGLLDSGRHSAAFCLGDLFDRESNYEEVLLEALQVLSKTSAVLAGNHDVPNRTDAVYSMAVLSAIYPDRVVLEKPRTFDLGSGSWLYLVPHCLLQSDFEEALRQVAVSAQAWKAQGMVERLLLGLHCSFDLGFETGETSLNLTRQMAEELLTVVDFILLGHDHIPADHFGGRLKIIGSLFPTAMDQIKTDHRVLYYDPGAGTFIEEPIKVSAFIGPASCAPEKGEGGEAGAQFLDLEDDLDPGQAAKLAVKLFSDGAFAVRVRPREESVLGEVRVVREMRSLPALIAEELQGEPDLLALWTEFSI